MIFNIFRTKTEKDKLQSNYEKCLKEAYVLSKTNRSASDAKIVEANKILEKIKTIN